MTTISISQPTYMPYLGFFDKIASSDIFVFFDDAQYEIRSFHNRCKIRTLEGEKWLSVPVSHPFSLKIKDVRISEDNVWKKNHLKMIETSYSSCKFFNKYWNNISSLINSDWQNLSDLNISLIEFFIKEFQMRAKLIRSSSLNLNSTKSTKLLEICKKTGGTTYLSGINGKKYLDLGIFSDAGIKVIFQDFIHPSYNQIHGEFIRNMSIIDLLLNEGNQTKFFTKL